jgi:hypothetical protein
MSLADRFATDYGSDTQPRSTVPNARGGPGWIPGDPMSKLTLRIDELAVDSFEMEIEQAERGTVDGNDALSGTLCYTPGTRLTCCPCTPAL